MLHLVAAATLRVVCRIRQALELPWRGACNLAIMAEASTSQTYASSRS
jgi:hypothetical protein